MEIVDITISGHSLEDIIRYSQAESITICLQGLSNEFTDPCLFPMVHNMKPSKTIKQDFPVTADLIHWLVCQHLLTTEQGSNLLKWVERIDGLPMP